jgi:hypothetical protein
MARRLHLQGCLVPFSHQNHLKSVTTELAQLQQALPINKNEEIQDAISFKIIINDVTVHDNELMLNIFIINFL